ncbi:MAG: MarR family transcriptional regulator [Burkholderiales bacterium]|nr:MarR family transcriptional regulator [Burkholderiales bacterium]MDE2454841.1 MarR family transcriptional regulator [Burkholderiales bacterium]
MPMKPRTPATFYGGAQGEVTKTVGHLMHRIVTELRRRIEQRMAVHGLTSAQWVPLWMLASGQGHTAQELTCIMHADAGSITRMLDRLEAKGLVERERSAGDRRVVELRLTAAGRATMRQVPPVLAEVNNAALAGFNAEEFALLKSFLERIHANVSQEETAPS